MSRVESFSVPGVECWFYSNDHRPPHFHARRRGEWSVRVFFLEEEARKTGESEYDLCDFICPVSKIKATELIDDLEAGETIKLILGDVESLKSVVQELKARDLKPDFEQEGEGKYRLTIVK